MSVSRLLENWQLEPSISDNIVTWQRFPAKVPAWYPFPGNLSAALVNALQEIGIPGLYEHQQEVWRNIQIGRNVVVSTGTASGKTLCYNLPILDRAIKDPAARALYLFPTKALAQDQAQKVKNLVGAISYQQISKNYSPSSITYSNYDGDTPAHSRAAVRQNARLVLSNPDMLHTGILPHHTAWVEFFENLRFVVLDEMHIYRGVFGSHVANVIRRLKRVASFYGSHPQFILTSATIANPDELAQKLIEEEVVVVSNDTSERGPRNFLIYNPPITNRELGIRRGALQESLHLAGDLLAYNVQTIIFTRSRRSVEILLTYLRQSQAQSSQPAREATRPDEFDNVIRGYRSGYLPELRREIEAGLRMSEVRVVVSTNALELGIDLGEMEAALLIGYPGTIASTLQQAGRAGRHTDASLSVLIASSDPLDQFLAHHPEYLLAKSPEQALIDPNNLLIILNHIRCAAFELPFRVGEGFGNVDALQVEEILDFLISESVLHKSRDRYFWMADQYPSQNISLRSASAENVILQLRGDEQITTLGHVDQGSAPWIAHPGAVYLHEAQTYRVDELDLENHVAFLTPVQLDYYTEPRLETTVELLEEHAQSEILGGTKAYGEVKVTTQVIGFHKIRWNTLERLGVEELDLPPGELITTAYWIAVSQETVSKLRDANLWTNDTNKYGAEWKRISEVVRARDHYRCQNCGIAESERAHDVHHKIPFRAFRDENGMILVERANHSENLVTLCHTCHRLAEASVRIRSGLAGLSYVMSHLAPLYLMCDPRDIGVHSDPRSDLVAGLPCMMLYERAPAGIGFSQRLYEIHDELVKQARILVSECACEDGCPSCVGPSGQAGDGGKAEALALLSAFSAL
jgi:DEAD/DEAH box helicase domain-containing protein